MWLDSRLTSDPVGWHGGRVAWSSRHLYLFHPPAAPLSPLPALQTRGLLKGSCLAFRSDSLLVDLPHVVRLNLHARLVHLLRLCLVDPHESVPCSCSLLCKFRPLAVLRGV